jgi:hypothetical protein
LRWWHGDKSAGLLDNQDHDENANEHKDNDFSNHVDRNHDQ